MGRHRAGTITCGIMLMLSICSAQSIAADRRAAVNMAEPLTSATTVHEQLWFVTFADTVLPDTLRMPHVTTSPSFAQPVWQMPLADFSQSKTPIDHKSTAAASHTAKVALVEPADSATKKSAEPIITQQDTEPFGFQTARARRGLLWIKWRKVRRAIKTEAPALARCRATASHCSPAAARFVAIVGEAAKHHGRARLQLVNQRINYEMRYVTDKEQWHRADVWSAPFDRHHRGSFQTGKGDCEDYAIAKYVALRDAGTPARDLRLLVVRDTTARSYHAVLAARQDGQWFLLDNRWRRLIPDTEAQFFTPLFALNTVGVERFTSIRVDNHRAPVKRTARAHDRTILAGNLGPTRGSV